VKSIEPLKLKVAELVLKDPRKAAMVLTAWLHQKPKKKAA
jgi:hypothetical protein